MLEVLILPKDTSNKNNSLIENEFFNRIESFEFYKLNQKTEFFFNNFYKTNEFDFILKKIVYITNIQNILKLIIKHPSIANNFYNVNLFYFYKKKKNKISDTTTKIINDFSELHLKDIHKVSRGLGIKIGLIDDGYNPDIINGASIFSFYPYDEIGNHGKEMHNLISFISPKSKIKLIKISDSHTVGRNDHELTILLGIIACNILKCDIINISHSIKLNRFKSFLFEEVFNKHNYLINSPIILSAGNENKNISKIKIHNYNSIFTIGAYDINKKIKSSTSNYGFSVDSFMPTWPNNGWQTSHAAILFTGYIANWFSFKPQNGCKVNQIKFLLNNYSIFINSYFNIKTIYITKLFEIMKKPHIKQRKKNNGHNDEIPYLRVGKVITKYAPPSGIIAEIIGIVEDSNKVKYEFKGYENINKNTDVYFLVGEFNSKNVAVNLVEITNINFKIENLSLFCPDKAGNPENQGTVIDTRPPSLKAGFIYYVIDSSKSIAHPPIYECTSLRELLNWDHVEYSPNFQGPPFTILNINGIWSDENT